jgi:hypothetical protein
MTISKGKARPDDRSRGDGASPPSSLHKPLQTDYVPNVVIEGMRAWEDLNASDAP